MGVAEVFRMSHFLLAIVEEFFNEAEIFRYWVLATI